LNYLSFKEFYKNNQMFVEVTIYCRFVYYDGGKFSVKYKKKTFVLKRYDKEAIQLKNGVNYIKCIHCGASIDVVKGFCEYCKGKIPYLQEWIIED